MKLVVVSVFSGEGPPVPIPNTVVKITCADYTWLATARKNRAMLTLLKRGNIFYADVAELADAHV